MTSALRSLKSTPISRDEFARLFQGTVPSVGWSKKIAVAHSGGPDSTCLLFLIYRYLQDLRRESPRALPSVTVSLTVNHGLQAASDSMARHCSDYAKSLGIEHISSTVPWSAPPFPDRPGPGESFEEIGRRVRYHILFNAMKQAGAQVLALGHHGDDQVETSLMRLAMGTTEIGAAGMRKVRRWGMGVNAEGFQHNVLGWAGLDGMNMWMIRPLLQVSKERILATCEENNLPFIQDSTNFQPELTLRNAIRHLLSKNTLDPQSVGLELPAHISEGLTQLQKNLTSIDSVDLDPSEGSEQLLSSVNELTEQVEDIENLVDTCLNRCHIPSPPATYAVTYRGLSAVRNPLVQRAIVLRIMRYASFHAWGALRADGNRRKKSLELIINNLWTPDPFAAGIQSFVAGGGVWWIPIVAGANRIKFASRRDAAPPRPEPNDTIGWLACRQPPLSQKRMELAGRSNQLWVDITDALQNKLRHKKWNRGEIFPVLWDNRFVLRLDIDKMPDDLVLAVLDGSERVQIQPFGRWYWPRIVRSNSMTGMETIIHNTLSTASQDLIDIDRDVVAGWDFRAPAREAVIFHSASWVEIEWIRSLSGL
ncbi:ATP-bind-3 domain-containing protein [Favolaschia claudopus]|uniref:tRNA(Ile)-lysidine synthetase n=1 Tax=Favolaschia claudopus TaxID=2862362 RepID=A0AAW0CJX3_9AGAR